MTDFSRIQQVVIDLDGVIIHRDSIIDGAQKAILKIGNIFPNIYFLTNSSLATSAQICDKLNGLGIKVNIKYVLSSASAVLRYCLNKNIKNIYLIAEDNIHDEFEKNDIRTDCVGKSSQAVVVLLTKHFKYKHISDSLACFQKNNNCLFVVANQDRNYPVNKDVYDPGCGALVSAVSYAADRSVDIVIGKPNPKILNLLLMSDNIPNESVMIIGDSIESDIDLAINSNQIGIYINNMNKLTSYNYNIESHQTLYDFSEYLELNNS